MDACAATQARCRDPRCLACSRQGRGDGCPGTGTLVPPSIRAIRSRSAGLRPGNWPAPTRSPPASAHGARAAGPGSRGNASRRAQRGACARGCPLVFAARADGQLVRRRAFFARRSASASCPAVQSADVELAVVALLLLAIHAVGDRKEQDTKRSGFDRHLPIVSGR